MCRRCKLVLIASLVLFLLTFFWSSPGSEPGPIKVKDGLGRVVKVEKTPERIVTTIPSTTEILLDLGAANQVVGVTSLTQYLSYVPKLQSIAEKKKKVGGFEASMEKIAGLQPDLAVIDGSAQPDLIPKLEKMGVKVYAAGSKDIEEVMETILELGRLVGSLKKAKLIVGGMKFKELKLKEAVASLEHKKRVLYAIDKTIYTTGNQTFLGRLLNLAGLKNIFAPISGFKPVSDEKIIQRNPELILIAANAGLNIEDLKKRSGFKQIEAVKEGEVVLLSQEETSIISQPGTKILDGAIHLFQKVYDKKLGI